MNFLRSLALSYIKKDDETSVDLDIDSFDSNEGEQQLRNSFSSLKSSPIKHLRNSNSNISLASLNSVNRQKVSFNDNKKVVLIPSRQEYIEAGIDLWYTSLEQRQEQYNVSQEIKEIMYMNPFLSAVDALTFLYQPSLMFNIFTEERERLELEEHESNSKDLNNNYYDNLKNSSPNSSKEIKNPVTFEFEKFNVNLQSDCKEKLNILIADCYADSCSDLKEKISKSLALYDKWVININQAECIDTIYEALKIYNNAINNLDVIVINSNIIYDYIELNFKEFFTNYRKSFQLKKKNNKENSEHTESSSKSVITSTPSTSPDIKEENIEQNDAKEIKIFDEEEREQVEQLELLFENLKTILQKLLFSIRLTYGRNVLIGLVMSSVKEDDRVFEEIDNEIIKIFLNNVTNSPTNPFNSSMNSSSSSATSVDFIWKQPILKYLHMLPILLNSLQNQKKNIKKRNSCGNPYINFINSSSNPKFHNSHSPQPSSSSSLLRVTTIPFPQVPSSLINNNNSKSESSSLTISSLPSSTSSTVSSNSSPSSSSPSSLSSSPSSQYISKTLNSTVIRNISNSTICSTPPTNTSLF